MTSPPPNPKIYHITHVSNLQGILRTGGLRSDAEILRQGGPMQAIGLSRVKQRRIQQLEVPCHPGTKVGEYVPFYFCPRSVMLYVIHRANHPELTYRGGQDEIVHLEADLHRVVAWADENRLPWAFSLSNAGGSYTEFRSDLNDLHGLDWNAIAARDFRAPDVKERKQAEFLVYGFFPFDLVDRVGVCNLATKARAMQALSGGRHMPRVEVQPRWYYGAQGRGR